MSMTPEQSADYWEHLNRQREIPLRRDEIEGILEDVEKVIALSEVHARRSSAWQDSRGIPAMYRVKALAEHALGASAAMSDSKATTAEPALKVVLEQALDDGLWFVAETITEQYLQSALRRLHFAVESAHPPAAPEGLERELPLLLLYDGDDPQYVQRTLEQAAALLQSRDATIEGLRVALQSIAANTCCDRCQEAALVARAALAKRQGG